MAWPLNLWIAEGTDWIAARDADALPARARRRGVLRGEDGRDAPVLIERVPLSTARRARRLLGLSHVNLLRLLAVQSSGPRGAEPGEVSDAGHLICAAPVGVDLLTAARAARLGSGLLAWWLAAVVAAAARGAQALHRHLSGQPGRWPAHGALLPASIFIGWQGEVQLLPGAAPDEAFAAPEALHAPALLGPAADVYGLGRLLLDLGPPPPGLLTLARQAVQWDPARRPGLLQLQDGLQEYLLEAAPLERAQALGAVLAELCPREAALAQEDRWEPDAEPAALPPSRVSAGGPGVTDAEAPPRPTPVEAQVPVGAASATPDQWTALRFAARYRQTALRFAARYRRWLLWAGAGALALGGALLLLPAGTPGVSAPTGPGVSAAAGPVAGPTAGLWDSATWRGLRVALVGVSQLGPRVRVVLRVVNLTREPQAVPGELLRLRPGDDAAEVEPRQVTPLRLLPGRVGVMTVEFDREARSAAVLGREARSAAVLDRERTAQAGAVLLLPEAPPAAAGQLRLSRAGRGPSPP